MQEGIDGRTTNDNGRNAAGFPPDGPGGMVGGRLLVRTGRRIVFVDPDDVEFISADGNYLHLHLREEEPHRVRGPLREVANQLDSRFVRIHRSTMVNVNHVSELHPSSNGIYEVVLESGRSLSLSRSYRDDLLSRAL